MRIHLCILCQPLVHSTPYVKIYRMKEYINKFRHHFPKLKRDLGSAVPTAHPFTCQRSNRAPLANLKVELEVWHLQLPQLN